jgi:hypothetical protein
VGVFNYLTSDGKTIRELRTPAEVFDPDSLRSFELVPLTNNHPTINNGKVTADNARALAVGTVSTVTRDSTDPNYVSALVAAWDADTVTQIESGKVELSCGYFCDREPAPAGATWKDPITGDSLPYDFTQRNIRGNHVALVATGRAGKEARIILDGSAVQVDETPDQVDVTLTRAPSPSEATMANKLIRIDGVSFEVTEQVADVLARSEAQTEAQIKTLKADADTAQGQVQALTAQVKALTVDLAAATDPKSIEARVNARIEIATLAESHGIKADGLDLDGVKRAVIVKTDATISLDGKSADYVAGLFDVLVTKASVNDKVKAGNPGTQKADAAPADKAGLTQNFRTGFFNQTQK